MIPYVFDIECDSLKPTKIHVLSVCYLDSKGEWRIKTTQDYDVMREFFSKENAMYIGHNIVQYDLPAVLKILGVKPKESCIIADTLGLSWYLYPGLKNYKLETFGEQFGIEKPKVEDWENADFYVYKERCEADVRINVNLWVRIQKFLIELYGDFKSSFPIISHISFKLYCLRLQEESRWKLDEEKCKKLVLELEALQYEKTDELKKAMPKVVVMGALEFPKTAYKKDGSISKQGYEWLKLKHGEGNIPEKDLFRDTTTIYESGEKTIEYVKAYKDANPNSPEQIKKWLFSLGWEPKIFKTVKGKDGDREVPQVNLPNGEGVCESITALSDREPSVLVLEGLSQINHRLGLVKGFLRHSVDGYIVAGAAGFANTLRLRHAGAFVNLPKVGTFYGEEIRGCLMAEEGLELCGADVSNLESNTKNHFIQPLDPAYVEEMSLPGFDGHLDIATVAKLVTIEEAEFYKWYDAKKNAENGAKYYPNPNLTQSQKEKIRKLASLPAEEKEVLFKRLKGQRHMAKTVNFSSLYSVGAKKLAKTLGIGVTDARNLLDAFWNRNWAVKKVEESLKVKTCNNLKWMLNPINGFWYELREERNKFSLLNQGAGAYCFDRWLYYILKVRQQLTGQMHDELILTIKEGNREGCVKLLKEAMELVNKELRLNVSLGCSVQFGKNYSDIH